VAGRHAPREEGNGDGAAGAGTATADLHTHTTRSDGVLEPHDLVSQASGVGIRLFAIADHDNLAAYRELTAPGAPPLPARLELVPAVELNAVGSRVRGERAEGELHVLGIGVDPNNEAFEATLGDQRDARRRRFRAMVERLRELELPIDAELESLDLGTDDALGRPTIARALIAAGYADSVEDAFERLIGNGLPAYVPRSGLGPIEAVRAVRAAGGLASLAHFSEAPRQVPLLRELIGEGLDGLESHHRSFDAATRAAVGEVARTLRLVETGGSDYHGDLGPYAGAHAELVMPDWLVRGVRSAMRARGALPWATA
jgi:predicted metal-dependent phosphoesterase TrpH